MATTHYIWDPVHDSYLMETDGAANTTAVYTNEPTQFGGLISQRRGETTHWYHFDALGSTRVLTDASQIITDTNLYDAWGVNLTSTGATENPFLYIGEAGYYYDVEVCTSHVRHRLLKSSLSRFLSQDPFADDEHNLYRYVRNNPVNISDPSGLGALEDCILAIRNAVTCALDTYFLCSACIAPCGACAVPEPAELAEIGLCIICLWACTGYGGGICGPVVKKAVDKCTPFK